MKKRAVVLGCGLVGTTLARDLADDPAIDVTAVDVNEANLKRIEPASGIATRQVDLSDRTVVSRLVEDFDVIVGALPSAMGFQTLRSVIEVGKPFCDISFMPQNALELDELANQRGVAAVVDCGVSPGLSNLCVGRAYAQLERTDRAVIYVGGLPTTRRWPYDYKAPFSPSDVIEEYTRPARMMENGRLVEKPALSEPELIDFARIGTLEAFNTDGLRTLLQTVDIPNMKEKTLRYPGHIELMRVLRETGFFDQAEIDVAGVRVRPRDVTAKLLFPKWRFEESEEEFTIMRVIVEGQQHDTPARYTYDLYDQYDRQTRTSSMARTTGFPCTIIARLLARGELEEAGVFPLERLAARAGLYEHMTAELEARGVNLTETVD
jgi:saccharopine dehydrogenase-like NADP-dependent oxidoreductase